MALSNGTYSLSGQTKHYITKDAQDSASWVSKARVLYTGGSSDTYATGGVVFAAASCGLASISGYNVRGVLSTSTTAVLGAQASWSTPKIMLFDMAGNEVANGTSLENYVICVEVEGYAP